jgi:hypothetical protein
MKKSLRLISMLLVIAMCLSLGLSSCNKPNTPEVPDDGGSTGGGGWRPPEDEYTIPKEEGYNQITFYWTYPGLIENCDVWAWWDGKEGFGYLLHECDYGVKAVINVPEGVEQVGFIVRRDCSDPGGTSWGSAAKDYDQDRFAKIEGRETVVYLQSGDPNQYSSKDGGQTLDMAKKFTMVSMADRNKLSYKLTPKTTISDAAQVKVLEDGKLIPILFRTYAIFAQRGSFTELTPSRDNVFFYHLGRTMEDAKISA